MNVRKTLKTVLVGVLAGYGLFCTYRYGKAEMCLAEVQATTQEKMNLVAIMRGQGETAEVVDCDMAPSQADGIVICSLKVTSPAGTTEWFVTRGEGTCR